MFVEREQVKTRWDKREQVRSKWHQKEQVNEVECYKFEEFIR